MPHPSIKIITGNVHTTSVHNLQNQHIQHTLTRASAFASASTASTSLTSLTFYLLDESQIFTSGALRLLATLNLE